MRKIKFVKSLNIEEVMVYDEKDIERNIFNAKRLHLQYVGDGEFIDAKEQITTEILPIHTFYRNTQNKVETTYIAWTPEVEEFLNLPFNILARNSREAYAAREKAEEEISRLEHEFTKFKLMSFINRLKFLFCPITQFERMNKYD